MKYKFGSYQLIDALKALKLDESTEEVSVKIRRGPGALQYEAYFPPIKM